MGFGGAELTAVREGLKPYRDCSVLCDGWVGGLGWGRWAGGREDGGLVEHGWEDERRGKGRRMRERGLTEREEAEGRLRSAIKNRRGLRTSEEHGELGRRHMVGMGGNGTPFEEGGSGGGSRWEWG